MSLRNLLGISLGEIEPSPETVHRLMAAADRQIADAHLESASTETRFGCAYSAIRMLADVGLHVNGYRTLTSKPGHHQTAIQTLPLTIGAAAHTTRVLDALRKQRHLTEYSGDLVLESAVADCIQHAKTLQELVRDWLSRNRPDLIGPSAP